DSAKLSSSSFNSAMLKKLMLVTNSLKLQTPSQEKTLPTIPHKDLYKLLCRGVQIT
ncbi:11988_t:CDS:2, partial [Entrophospora sp. SA101]